MPASVKHLIGQLLWSPSRVALQIPCTLGWRKLSARQTKIQLEETESRDQVAPREQAVTLT